MAVCEQMKGVLCKEDKSAHRQYPPVLLVQTPSTSLISNKMSTPYAQLSAYAYTVDGKCKNDNANFSNLNFIIIITHSNVLVIIIYQQHLNHSSNILPLSQAQRF